MNQQVSPTPASTTDQMPDLSPSKRFLRQLAVELPPPYRLAQGKIQVSGSSRKTMVPICSPLRVSALARNSDGRGWARLVEVLTPDGRIIDCVVPDSDIEAKPRDAIAMLADRGMRVYGQHDGLIDFLKAWSPQGYALRLDRPGWSSDRTAFALADGRVIASQRQNETQIYTGTVDRVSTGSLEAWRSGMAALAVGNPYLIFAISHAFSGPLLALTEQTGGIFHLHGSSSIGKTKALLAALSVWPRSEKEYSWRATSAGLEGLLVATSDTLLGIDELLKEPHAGFGDDIYLAVNGAGKNRATVTGQAQTRQHWQVPILSTGEVPVHSILRNLGTPMRGGQSVRMIDIPVTGMTYGVFDNLHGHDTARLFARTIESIAPRDSGHAGAAFVGKLIDASSKDAVPKVIEKVHAEQYAKLMQHLGLDHSAGNEVLRVLDRFALIATAGEIASKMKITGWKPGAASQAVAQIAAIWYEHRGSDTPTDHTSAVEITRDYLLAHGASRFANLDKGDQAQPRAPETRSYEAAGFQDEEYYYVLGSALQEMHRGYDLKRVCDSLVGAGYLEPKGKNGWQTRLSGVGEKRPWVYKICKTIIAA